MPIRDTWSYHEAQKNALERLQKEWEPPAVPCATPMTAFLKKRIHPPLSNAYPAHSNPKHLKTDRSPQRRLCASYTLQLNDLHVLMPRSMAQYGIQKTGVRTLCASYPIRNTWGRRDYLKTPKVHDVLLKYGGPEASGEEPNIFVKKILSQMINPPYEVNVKKIENSQKTFYIGMPQSQLRVGNLDPKRCHLPKRKKEPFIV